MNELAKYSGICILLCCCNSAVFAQPAPALSGAWRINDELSDNTDRQVEASLRAAGERIQRRLLDPRRDRYRGGPPEHELYDRLSYDDSLTIELGASEFLFTYDEDYRRTVHADRRDRPVSLSGLNELADFSTAHWDGDRLIVEAWVRDGGYTEESYTLLNGGAQLKVELFIKPRTFQLPIEIARVYDRVEAAE